MANFGFIIDNRKCIGCHACTVACKSEHEVPVGVNRTWVKYIEKGEFPNSRRLFSVMRCNHCDDAPCVEICPVTALYRRPDGIIDFDSRRCIGCKACMQACPYDALYIDPETSTAAKCNYCAHRIDIGLEPACVNVCPTQAIISGDLDDPNSQIAQLRSREQVTARKTEKGTRPSLFYIEGDVSSLEPSENEANNETMWGKQVSGVGHYARYMEQRKNPGPDMEALERFLSLGERDPVWEPDRADEKYKRNAEQVRKELADYGRRSYDAPGKGVLWGWQVTCYLWTKAISAGLCILTMTAVASGWIPISASIQWVSVLLSILFLGLTGLLLMADLDQPKRFLNVLLRPQWRSWLVRGAYIIAAYGVALALWCVFKIFSPPMADALAIPLIILAVLTAIYTAFLFAQAKGRDFWQNSVLPIHMLAHAVMAGGAVFALTLPFASTEWQAWIRDSLIMAIALKLACDMFEMCTKHPTRDAQRTATMIFHGRYSTRYWVVVFLLGGVIPLVTSWTLTVWLMPLAGILILVGIYVAEHIWVHAPQRIPLA